MISKSIHKICCEDPNLIENYDKAIADMTQHWYCHHRLEVQGQFTNSAELLKKCGMYFNRPASELIFLSPQQHTAIHHDERVKGGTSHTGMRYKDWTISIEDTQTRKTYVVYAVNGICNIVGCCRPTAYRIANKGGGTLNGFIIKVCSSTFKYEKQPLPLTAEEKHAHYVEGGKKAASKLGHTHYAMHKGTTWWNNGSKCIRSVECPGEGFVKGRLTKGCKWYNDGNRCVKAFECPEGFKPGRIYQRKK